MAYGDQKAGLDRGDLLLSECRSPRLCRAKTIPVIPGSAFPVLPFPHVLEIQMPVELLRDGVNQCLLGINALMGYAYSVVERSWQRRCGSVLLIGREIRHFQNGGTEMKEFKGLVLCDYRSERVDVHVRAALRDGVLTFSGQDLGPFVEEMWGDGDYRNGA